MQENELNTNPPPEDCPSNTELAALLDGTLEASRAEAVRRHVLACPDCYEIYADAHHFEVEAASNVLSFEKPAAVQAPRQPAARKGERGRARRAWFPMAAGLVLAALSAYLVGPYSATAPTRPNITVKNLAQAGQLSAVSLASLPNDVNRSGSSDEPQEAGIQAKVQIATQRVDLEVAALQGNRAAMDRFVIAMLQTSRGIHAEETKAARANLQSFHKSLGPPSETPLPDADIRKLRSAADGLLDRDGPGLAYQTFGIWAEAGRLASRSEQPSFFESDKNRACLEWLLWKPWWGRPEVVLSPVGRETLKLIKAAWPEEGKGAPEFEELADAFARLQQPGALASRSSS